MKVIHLLSTSTFSGAENVVCQIIDLYKTDNINMSYCSVKGPIESNLEDKKIDFKGLNKFSYFEFKKILKEYKPDVIHAHDIKASILASFFSRKYKIISHIHGNSEGMKKTSVKSLLYLFAAIKFKHIFWVSKSSLDEYKFKKNILNKSSVLANIISVDKIIKQSKEKGNQKSDVIFVGRLVDIKNPLRLIEIFKKVLIKVPNAKLNIVGSGILENNLKEIINNNELEKNVFLLGFQKNPYKFMKNSKIMLMTSRFEGTPMCALEAMTLGLPIVSTPTDGLVEIVENDKNGYLSSNNDELADKIVELISDDILLKKMSNFAKEKSLSINNKKNYKNELDLYYKNR